MIIITKQPEETSEVIGIFVIAIQNSMPDEIRNSTEWKRLLPLAAGTGRDHEPERLAIILDWMWTVVLPSIQWVADDQGIGAEWSAMTTAKTKEAAKAAEAKAAAVEWASDAMALAAEWAATAAREVVSAKAVRAVVWATEDAANSAKNATEWGQWEAARTVWLAAWRSFDVCGLLKRLIEEGGSK